MEVVTCLHGFSQHGDSWDELAGLVGGRFRWLKPDLQATTLEDAVDEVLGVWEREGIRRSHLIGYSQGGRLALRLACGHPERLLTLTTIGAHAGLEGATRRDRRAEDLALAGRIEQEGVEWFASHWASLPIFRGLARRGPVYLERLDASRRSHRAAELAAVLRGLGPGVTPPFWDRLPLIEASTLIVAGVEDPPYVEYARRLAAAIPRSRVAIVPAAGHAAHLEQPAATARLVADHLSSR
jgi:2-succinyl-6-hydroxy-2,4-cyclohexadiene-1-carboxylate synthase